MIRGLTCRVKGTEDRGSNQETVLKVSWISLGQCVLRSAGV